MLLLLSSLSRRLRSRGPRVPVGQSQCFCLSPLFTGAVVKGPLHVPYHIHLRGPSSPAISFTPKETQETWVVQCVASCIPYAYA